MQYLIEPVRNKNVNIDGQVEYLFPPGTRFPSIWEGDAFVRSMYDALVDVDFSEKDTIVFTGSTWALGAMMFALRGYMDDTKLSSVTVHVYHARDCQYKPITLHRNAV